MTGDADTHASRSTGRFVRVGDRGRSAISFSVDGVPAVAAAGDTILVAVLSVGRALRMHEFDGGARAGFCLMGACQDCWMWMADGGRVRACTTPITPGLALLTRPPGADPRDA
jgi:hypothetical protein